MEAGWWYVSYSIQIQCWNRIMSTSKEELVKDRDSIIKDLEQEGLVDSYFRMSEQLKEVNGLHFFANLVPAFINDTRNSIMQLESLLAQPYVDFLAVDQIAIKLKGSSSCIGACRIASACSNLRRVVETWSKQGCVDAVNEIKSEFRRIHPKFDVIAELERRIIRS